MSERGPKVGVVPASADLVRSLLPRDHLDRKSLIRVGFWKGPHEPDLSLPDPVELVDAAWDEAVCRNLFEYVERHPVVSSYRGWSTCRICGKPNGSQEKSDGKYIWPSGLGHYIMAHKVKPPEDFLKYVYDRMALPDPTWRDGKLKEARKRFIEQRARAMRSFHKKPEGG